MIFIFTVDKLVEGIYCEEFEKLDVTRTIFCLFAYLMDRVYDW